MKKFALLTCAFLLAASLHPAKAVDDNSCGTGLHDWCTPPSSDRCSRHKDEASCIADPDCYGVRYTGESVTACKFDARNFGTNCPTVGCTSEKP